LFLNYGIDMATLYLASQSASRQYLLREAKIPFTLLSQSADEKICDWSLSLEAVVGSIAKHKMNSVVMPAGVDGQAAFVLTADTLTQGKDGHIYGKPGSYEEAVATLQALQPSCRVATAFCLRRTRYEKGAWLIEAEREVCVVSRCEFEVSGPWIDRYFQGSAIGWQCAGGMAIEGFGMQFLRSLDGSYSAVIGLPLFELRQALDEMGFFEHK
jgi:septum formation protein